MDIDEIVVAIEWVEDYVQIVTDISRLNLCNPYEIMGGVSLVDIIGWRLLRICSDKEYVHVIADKGSIRISLDPDLYNGPEAFYYARNEGGGFFSA
ncbi:hypothetical protein [Tistrella mobilis]|uniref:hypothetical protein n=1 Tax=Tistrella mobilis TaxID=171437 RepID=UPI003556FAEA